MPATATDAQRRPNGPNSYTPFDFANAVLQKLNIDVTEDNMRAMLGWMKAEGGAGPQWGIPNNKASYNPLNTTLDYNGSGDTGVQGNISVYKSWEDGVEATTKTLKEPQYNGLRGMLSFGTYEDIAKSIIASPWGTKNPALPSIMKSVDVKAAAKGSHAQTIAEGHGNVVTGAASGVISGPLQFFQSVWERITSEKFWLSVGKILLGVIALVLGVRFIAKNFGV